MQIVKFAEYVDILEQIIYAKYKNNRAKDNGYTGCTKMEKKPPPFLTVHSPLLGKQQYYKHLEWFTATFIWLFLPNLGEI